MTPGVVVPARAYRITREDQLIGGPLAHGRIGDYLLENEVARFIIQDVRKRDIYSVGAFGGNLIDAELVARPGTDNFIEIQPALNIESVINAQDLVIVNDGADGSPAIIRTCGPDDLLDFVNASTIIAGAGLPFPAAADDTDYEIEACTEYALTPGQSYVRMTTTVLNNQDNELGLFVGDYINAGGELEQWASSPGNGMGEPITGFAGVLSYIGYGEATGTDYAHITIPIAGSRHPRSTFFTASGVSYVMQSNSILQVILGSAPTFYVPAGGSASYTRYFSIGDGSGGNAVSIENEVKNIAAGTLRGCVRAAGQAAPNTRVSVLLGGLISVYVTDAAGCYEGTLRPGSYEVAAARAGSPYEGGGSTPRRHPITISAGVTTELDIELPATGHIRVAVIDETGQPVPARITMVGFDPSPPQTITSTSILGNITTGLFHDLTSTGLSFGLAWFEYTDANGRAAFDIEPGRYQLYVSRGTEYSLFETAIEVAAGESLQLDAQIAHVIDTSGFVSSDFHVHGINSADSRVSHRDRVLQFAGEGVDNIIMTDHHSHTDLNPRIAELGFTEFVHATVGEEITTWDYGHYNAYPLTIDPTRPSGGSTDWAREAPPGRDFPSYGAYGLTPKEVHDLATSGPRSTADTTIQINHISDHFSPLRIDTTLVPPQSLVPADRRLQFRLEPNTTNLFFQFPALELWNGSGRSDQSTFLNTRLGVWFNLLNQGLICTAIADTDTHGFSDLGTAGARSWTAAPTDAPVAIEGGQVARQVNAGRLVGGQGLYVQTKLRPTDDSVAVADLTLAGTHTLTAANRAVFLDIDVQAPLWAEYDRIDVYANAETTVAARDGGVPVMFGAVPTLTLRRGADFETEMVDVFPEVSGGMRRETHVRVPFSDLSGDTWFVVVVRGSDGVSKPMFPVMVNNLNAASNQTLEGLIDGNRGEGGTMALGFTNALYADIDGTPGFQAPRAP